jgi:hypothetical protein
MATRRDEGNGGKARRIGDKDCQKERHTRLAALLDVIRGLREARVDAEKLNDELLLYLINMAIRHASTMLADHLDNCEPATSIP